LGINVFVEKYPENIIAYPEHYVVYFVPIQQTPEMVHSIQGKVVWLNLGAFAMVCYT
jgi:hypothetical protein